MIFVSIAVFSDGDIDNKDDDEDELTGLNSFVLRFSSPSSSRSV